MLKAKVSDDSRFAPITSCSGVSFFRDTWTIVPLGFEAVAKACEFLDTKEFDDEPEPFEDVIAEVQEVAELVIEEEPVKDAPNATEGAIKLARDMKIDLAWVTGTGKNGKTIVKDIEDYLAQKVD